MFYKSSSRPAPLLPRLSSLDIIPKPNRIYFEDKRFIKFNFYFTFISKQAKNPFEKPRKSASRGSQPQSKFSFKKTPLVKKTKAICKCLNRYQCKLYAVLKKKQFAGFTKFIKKNAARAGILICALFVSYVNLRSQNKNIFAGDHIWEDDSALTAVPRQIAKNNSLATAEIADAPGLADYEQFLKEEGEKNTVLGAMMPVTNPTSEEFEESGEDVFVYKVQDGDTLGSIAQKYSITVNTILWANDLYEDSVIKPGDDIFILPITGLKHKVKKGDTVKSLAKKYNTKKDKIISFNSLPANGELTVGEEIVIPDGQGEDRPRYPDSQATRYAQQNNIDVSQVPTSSSSSLYKYPAHRFPYGWCTWYVASRRHVPWGGNAGTWLYHARAYGASTGKTPKKGAILVTNESRWGHVAIVEKVSGNTITVSEMNYQGWGVKSSRTLSTKSGVIKGYIY